MTDDRLTYIRKDVATEHSIGPGDAAYLLSLLDAERAMTDRVCAYRVCIAMPSFDMMHTDCAVSLLNLGCYSTRQGIPLMLTNPRMSIVHKARCEAVRFASIHGATHLFFVDSDMRFPADALARLLNHRMDVVGANYVKRGEHGGSTGVALGGRELKPRKRLHQVDSLGTGLLLIRMTVFRDWAMPYFNITWDDVEGEFQGEDWTFCRDCRERGIKVWCDGDLSAQCEHVGTKRYSL